MPERLLAWLPAMLLALGAGTVFYGVQQQQALPLRSPLEATLPAAIGAAVGRDVTISDEERELAGVSSYLMRVYDDGQPGTAFSLYVGYYESQAQGRTIHSPKNCLPGAGWEPLTSERTTISTAGGEVPVNRYVLRNETRKALVLYWYQGRGRVAANEYAVKWHLLRDQAITRRSDEALVRIFMPVTTTEADAFARATEVVRAVLPQIDRALPAS